VATYVWKIGTDTGSATSDVVPTTTNQRPLVRAQAVGKTRIAVRAALYNVVRGVEIATWRIEHRGVREHIPLVAVKMNGYIARRELNTQDSMCRSDKEVPKDDRGVNERCSQLRGKGSDG
jgi:hypothetical protein